MITWDSISLDLMLQKQNQCSITTHRWSNMATYLFLFAYLTLIVISWLHGTESRLYYDALMKYYVNFSISFRFHRIDCHLLSSWYRIKTITTHRWSTKSAFQFLIAFIGLITTHLWSTMSTYLFLFAYMGLLVISWLHGTESRLYNNAQKNYYGNLSISLYLPKNSRFSRILYRSSVTFNGCSWSCFNKWFRFWFSKEKIYWICNLTSLFLAYFH